MKLHHKTYGSGRPIVIMHGLFGMLDNWHTFASHLSNEYKVITVDLRNHGRSPHDGIFDYDVMAEDIVDFLRKHEPGQTILMGHSLGGKVAMQTALSYPEVVERLIVVDIAPREYPSVNDTIVEALLNTDLQGMTSRKQIQQALMDRLGDPGVVLFLMKNVARQEDGSLIWRMNLPVLALNYPNTTSALEFSVPYHGPTLFVRGGKSSYVRDEDWPDIQRLFPLAQLETVENAGHWVHADAMEELLEITRTFLG